MVVAPGPDPSRMQAKPMQFVAGGFFEVPGHIGHVPDGCQLLNVQPLPLAFLHGAPWIRSLFQPKGMKFMRLSIGSSLAISLCFLDPRMEDLSFLALE